MKRSLIALSVALTLAACNSDTETTSITIDDNSSAIDNFTLQLLHLSDMDGSNAVALANAGNMAALVNGFTSQFSENTLFLSSGDNYIPGSRYEAAADDSMMNVEGVRVPGVARADIAMLNAMGLQASAVGNHDLDGGSAEFAEIVGRDGEYLGAQFPYLSSNMDFTTDDNTKHLVVETGKVASDIPNGITSSTVIEVNGHKIGIVGITTPTNDEITTTDQIAVYPANDSIIDLAAIAQAEVDALLEQGINKVIALAHMQSIQLEQQLAPLLKHVDIIVAGGSNTLLANEGDRLWSGDAPAGSYPIMLKDADGKDVAIVNVDGDYKYLGRLLVEFDANGDLIANSITDVSRPYVTDDAMVAATEGAVNNAEVDAIVNAVNQVIISSEENIVGHTDVYLNGVRDYVRTEETNLGNLTADANLWYAQQHDSSVVISLKNGGGIRAAIGYSEIPAGSTSLSDLEYYPPAAYPLANKQEGDISQYDIQSALAFNNELAVLDLTAAQLYDVLESTVAGVENTSGGFAQVSGLCMSYDATKAARVADAETGVVTVAGQRIQSLIVDTNRDGNCDANTDEVVVENGALVSNATFKTVTLSYLSGQRPFPCTDDGANGCSNQTLLADAGVMTTDPQQSSFAVTGSEQDAIAEYLQAFHKDSTSAYTTADSIDGGAADTRIVRLD